MDAKSIISAVESVTKPWAKQRKAEEKGSRRPRVYYYSDRVNFTEIACDILPEAYLHASGNGQYPVSQRQLYYASRDKFLEITGREIESSYFSQTILRKYLNEHQPNWRITADPRGTFTIPNASYEKRIPVGTISIDNYLGNRESVEDLEELAVKLPIEWPSLAEKQRYAAILYIEKEGFDPLLNAANIAERFDLAILSCKGQSVVAARKLVDYVCSQHQGVPLFIVHDFDKYGFEIAECLTRESQMAEWTDRVAYRFKNEINYIDFGLRLEDVKKYNLPHETCKKNHGAKSMTKQEREFMFSGKRVELNAFTAPQFIEWLESKLKKHLPTRLVPEDTVLEQAFRRAIAVYNINKEVEAIRDEATSVALSAKVPNSLRKQLKAEMQVSDKPWDVVLYELVQRMQDES